MTTGNCARNCAPESSSPTSAGAAGAGHALIDASCENHAAGMKSDPSRPAIAQSSHMSKATALSGGYSSTLLQSARGQSGEALRLLEECRKQREQQGSLLRQADQHLEAARKAQQDLRVEGIRRVGAVPTSRELTAAERQAGVSTRSALVNSADSSSRPSPPSELPPQAADRPTVLGAGGVRQRSPRSPVSAAACRLTWDAGITCASPPPSARRRQQLTRSPLGQRSASGDVAVEPGADDAIERLSAKGLLVGEAQADQSKAEELMQVRTLFSAQVPDVEVHGVYRIANQALAQVYKAVGGTMGQETPQLRLWHGTTSDCVHNIVLHGFNRAYSGRHGTKLGLGTYFSADAAYSLRFCSRKAGRRRVMLLSTVLAGTFAKGSPDLVEPPVRDADQMSRYDATVDNIDAPKMYCIFRDYQALPSYLVEFAGCAG